MWVLHLGQQTIVMDLFLLAAQCRLVFVVGQVEESMKRAVLVGDRRLEMISSRWHVIRVAFDFTVQWPPKQRMGLLRRLIHVAASFSKQFKLIAVEARYKGSAGVTDMR